MVTEVHLGIPEHLLISISWTEKKEVVFLVFVFFNNKHKYTHNSVQRGKYISTQPLDHQYTLFYLGAWMSSHLGGNNDISQ